MPSLYNQALEHHGQRHPHSFHLEQLDMGMLSLSLLGHFRAARDGQPLGGIESIKGQALLACLAVEAQRPHTRNELAWLLWPEVPDAVALTNLRQTLANLRNALGDRTNPSPYLLVERASIQFNPASDYQLDVAEFKSLLDTCTQHHHRHPARCTSCARRFARAISLYQGHFLTHFLSCYSEPFEQWVEAQREPLQQQVLVTLERLVEYHERRGEYEQALEYARRQVALAPWDEAGHRKVIKLLVPLGQRSAALAHYHRMVEVLDEELGVEPDAESRQLHEQLHQGAVDEVDDYEPPKHNLPTPSNRFIGREAVLVQLHALLEEPANRLVTVVGPGGIGKTRLALQAASEQCYAYQDGVYFVGLAPIRDPTLVLTTIMQALGIQEEAGQPLLEPVTHYLHNKELLLLLDNFEQVVAAAPAVAELLSAAPGLQILVTSREALNLSGEHLFPAPPLMLPDTTHSSLDALSRNEALQLFVQRAQAVKPSFSLTEENALMVAKICAQAEGLPLAIELAASRIKTLAPRAILERLQYRLQLLTHGPRDLPTRQQTLRATIDWSYQLLIEEEQRLFARLAVFVGGATLDAIEAVCTVDGDCRFDIFDGISSLVDKSLLHQEEGPDGEPRFGMLQTIHEYARERLDLSGEGETLQRAHAAYYLAPAEEAEPHLTGREQAVWLERLEQEHDNLRAALRGGPADVALRLAGALWRFWYVRGHLSEGRVWLTTVLSTEVAGQVVARTRALNAAGNLALLQGDYATARGLHQENLAIRRELGDKFGIAQSLNNLCIVAHEQGEYAAARALCEESLAIRHELGDKFGIAHSLSNLGNVAYNQGDYVGARALYEESLVIFREVGDKARSARAVEQLAALAAMEGVPERAAHLWAAAETLRAALGAPLPPKQRTRYERAVVVVRRELDEAAFAAAWAKGRAMTLEQAIAYALEDPT